MNAIGIYTYLSDGAVAQWGVVKQGSDASHVAQGGAADTPIGVALNATTGAGQTIRVALLPADSTIQRFAISSAAITVGSLLEPAANGKVQSLSGGVGTHHVLGRAIDGATGADQLIRIIPMYFLRVI